MALYEAETQKRILRKLRKWRPLLGRVYIYGLHEYRKPIIYIGQTADPVGRMRSHLSTIDDSCRARWVISLALRNRKPVMTILAIVEPSMADETEMALVAAFPESLNYIGNKNRRRWNPFQA